MEFKMVVGLGNPGPEYERTYHNCGFLLLDHLLCEHPDIRWKQEAAYRVAQHGNVLYVKPSSFMNESGRGVLAAARYYRVKPERLMVLHDDADLPLGTFRVRRDGGSGGHHGIESIIASLASDAFWRGKIGIRRALPPDAPETKRIPATDLVLRAIGEQDMQALQGVFAAAGAAIRNVIENEMP